MRFFRRRDTRTDASAHIPHSSTQSRFSGAALLCRFSTRLFRICFRLGSYLVPTCFLFSSRLKFRNAAFSQLRLYTGIRRNSTHFFTIPALCFFFRVLCPARFCEQSPFPLSQRASAKGVGEGWRRRAAALLAQGGCGGAFSGRRRFLKLQCRAFVPSVEPGALFCAKKRRNKTIVYKNVTYTALSDDRIHSEKTTG